MCNYFDNKIAPKKLEEVYNRTYDLEEHDIKTSEFVNGFAHDKMPIIADEVSEEFVIGSWGISAPWIKEDDKKALLPLNARLDTIETKSTFKNNVNNRCAIPVNAFYEWDWKDAKGKVKEKNRINVVGDDIFSLGAIYYIDKNGVLTFAVCTTEANELMAKVHHTKLRMPIILPIGKENDWLDNKNSIQDFAFPNYDVQLKTLVVE